MHQAIGIFRKKKQVGMESPRIKTIIRMMRERYSLVEIGKAVGVKRQRIRQIIKDDIIPALGESVLSPDLADVRVFSIDEVAQRIGETVYIISNAIEAGVPVCMRGKRIFFSEGNIKDLKDYIAKSRKGICRICKQEFEFEHPEKGRHPLVCYKPACQRRYNSERRINWNVK